MTIMTNLKIINQEEKYSDLETFKGKDLCPTFIKSGMVRINTKSNTLTFNSGFYRKYEKILHNKTHVILGYSKSKNAITIKTVKHGSYKGSHKLFRYYRNNKVLFLKIYCPDFFSYFKLKDLAKSLQAYFINILKHGKNFVIYLDN